MAQVSKEGERSIPKEQIPQRSMSRLAIVRHGEYGSDFRLNDQGRVQIQALAERLRQSFDGERETALILSSIAPRALDSAEIIAGILQAPLEAHEVLWSEASHPEDLDEAYQLLQSAKSRADLLVFVTHYEYAEEFPGYLGEKDLDKLYISRSVGKGQGVILDYRNKSITTI